jgi:thiamine transport system substrate-binding protein
MRRRLALAALLALTACGSDSPEDVTLKLVTYDSFPTEGTPLNDALAAFTAETGVDVEILRAGDAGTMVSKAVLTAGNPEGDVMFGVDNTLLSRAIDADVFAPYTSGERGALRAELTALVPNGEATPVDFGDVCLNYDIAWFEEHDLTPPATFADLTDPEYEDLLVVEDPASSSPGLAFLLATIAALGEDGWQEYWRALRDNGVEVVASWDSAYYERFSGSSGAGPRPLVVSYGTSPPAEVLFADPPRDDAPTAVIAETCFRQIEFAGVLRGTEHESEAQALVDFLAGPTFQAEIALNLFVYPARTDVALPEAFTKFSVQPEQPRTMPPADIAANREKWVDEWTEIVLR